MPSAGQGTLAPCPLCAAEKRTGGLRNCLLSLQPSIHVTVCMHPECIYFSPSETLSTVEVDPNVTQRKVHYSFEGLDSALFIICNSIFLTYSHENNVIPKHDILYNMMEIVNSERKNVRLMICDVKKLVLSQFLADLEDTWASIKGSFEKLGSLSHFLKKCLSVKWNKEMKCINKCRVDCESDTTGSVVCSPHAGILEFLPTPVVVSNNVKCDVCQTGKQTSLVNVQRSSNFVMLSTSNGIQLPMEGNLTCFQEKGSQAVYRLHSITVRENNNNLVTFLCDTLGHLRTQFQCQTLTSFKCTLKLSSVRPKSIVFVVFEKLFENGTQDAFKSLATQNQSYLLPTAKSFVSQASCKTPSIYIPKSLKRQHNSASRSTLEIDESPWSFERAFPTGVPKMEASSTSQIFAKRKFQSYTRKNDSKTSETQSRPEVVEQNRVKDAMTWRDNIQRRFLSIADDGRRAKVSNYIATLQNLNVKILESESVVNSKPKSRSGRSTPFSVSKVLSHSAHATPRITPVHSPSAATVHVSFE